MSAPDPEPDWPSPAYTQNLRSAVDSLGQAVDAPPLEVQMHACEAEKRVVLMRDELIGRLRSDPDAAQGQRIKDLLHQVNSLLSLIVGIEYPSNFIRREMIQQARDTLQSMLD